MSALGAVLSLAMLGQTVRASVPYVLAAQGGVWSERSGVVNIALEGMLLAGGLASVAVSVATGSAVLGLVGAAAAGVLLGLLHVTVVERGRVDAIISGLAINLIAAGGTRVVLRTLYKSSSNSPAIEGFRRVASGGVGALVSALVDPMTLLCVAAVAVTVLTLKETRLGLRVRASGEGPVAAAGAGVPVVRVRTLAVAIGGALAGLGGAALAYDQHQFQSGMSGGRGFIALAAVVLSGWRAGRAAALCVAFAVLDALQVALQGQTRALQDVVQMLPYAAALFALGALARPGRTRLFGGPPPAGLGKHAS